MNLHRTLVGRNRALLPGLLSIIFLSSAPILAQQTAARPDRGIMAGASYSVSDTENISLTNGNLNLSIPLAALPPIAGGKLKFSLNAVYNSKLWNITRAEYRVPPIDGCVDWIVNTPQLSNDSGGWNNEGGWRIAAGYQLRWRSARADFAYFKPDPYPPEDACGIDQSEQSLRQSEWFRLVLISPDGAEHELRPSGYQPYTGNSTFLKNYYRNSPATQGVPMTYYSIDGSLLWVVLNPSGSTTLWTAYQNDGTRIVQTDDEVQRIQDTNGNSIKIYSDTEAGHILDERTGREIKFIMDYGANDGAGQGHVLYQTVGGVWETIDINYGFTYVRGKTYEIDDYSEIHHNTCRHQEHLDAQLTVIREIVFPASEPGVAARRFSFQYNSDTTESVSSTHQFACDVADHTYSRTASKGMGDLSRMETPTGAVVKYSYSRDSIHDFTDDTDDIARETVTQKSLTHDGTTDFWTYNISSSGMVGPTVTSPDGSFVYEFAYSRDTSAGGYLVSSKGGLVYRTNSSNKILVERHWTMMKFDGGNANATGAIGETSFNPVVDAEYTSLLDDTLNHNPIKMSAKTYQYDYNGNLLSETDYDWFDPTGIQRDSNDGVPTGVPAGATVLRTITNSFYNNSSASSSGNVYAKRSLSTASPLILNAPRETSLGSAVTRFSYDSQNFDVAPTIGNVTTKELWNDFDNNWITTAATYDAYGNLRTATDGRHKVTTYDYANPALGLPTSITVDPQNGTGTQTASTAYDFSTGLVINSTDANNQTKTIDYTNQLLAGSVPDPFGRPGVIIGPQVTANGVNQHHRTRTIYEDSLRRVTVASDLNAEGDYLLKSRTTSDSLGRIVLTEQTEDGTNYTIYARKAYDQMGKITYASAPMRYGVSSSTDSWTRVTNDLLGRVTEVATFGGATQPAATGTGGVWTGKVATSYYANSVTVIDQDGKVRRSLTNSLGQLVRVDEPDNSGALDDQYSNPIQPTCYQYDVLGNLRKVIQGAQIDSATGICGLNGSQQRTFTYDSLSRLRTAQNPESGTVNYAYDDNGNLTSKTDARSITTNYVYDGLNRITSRSYTNDPNSTPAVTYVYDSATGVSNPKGRLMSVSSSVSKYSYNGYDADGKVFSATQTIYGTTTQSYTTTYTNYDLAGHLITMTYPSGRTVTNSYDNAGRLQNFSGDLGGTSKTYASGIIYDAGSRMTKEQFGTTTAIFNKLFYNSRGQLSEIREGTTYTGPSDTGFERGAIINYYSDSCWGMCSGLPMADNNGNLKKQEHWIKDTNGNVVAILTQRYDYDSLNRLQRVYDGEPNSPVWQQHYTYDRWGNRTVDTDTTGLTPRNYWASTATNKLYAAGETDQNHSLIDYDAVGNQKKDYYTDNYYGVGKRYDHAYDAENRMTSSTTTFSDNSTQISSYNYDGDGRRVKRNIGGVETWQVYGVGGELLDEYAANANPQTTPPQKEYGYRNGQLLITADAPVSGGGGSGSWGSPPGFNGPDPLLAGYDIKLENLTDLRSAVNQLRSHAGLGPFNFTVDPNPDLSTTVKADHIRQLRTALEGARTALGLPNGGYAHATLTENQSSIYAIDFQELRQQIRSAWNNGNVKLPLITATSSTDYSPDYNASHAIDNNYEDLWSAGAFQPQWIQVDLGQAKTISQVRLLVDQAPNGHTRHDVYGGPSPDNLTLLGTFDGDTVKHQWLELNTSASNIRYIKVSTTQSPSWVGWAEIEVYGPAAGTTATQLHWLVSDQLGTPRMIFDQSGSLTVTDAGGHYLSGMTRHDYLPFGEELGAGSGSRTAAQGYSASDGVRQHFTGYERDGEIGLDYAKARYFGNSLGRFSSPDPLMASGKPWIPQSWNRYTYCLNNPLKFSDPTGLIWVYHWLNKDHTQIGVGWVDGKKIPKGYQALAFGRSGVAVLNLSGGRQLAILHSDSRVAQLVSVTSGSRPSNSDTVPNPSLVREFSRRTEPMPAATGLFVGLSVTAGYFGASSPLNAAAYLAYALHQRAHDDAQIAASTRISMDDAIDQAVDHVGPNGIMEQTGSGKNFQFRSMGYDADGNPEVRIGRFDVNPNTGHGGGPHLNLETQGASPKNLHIPINPETIRPGDFPVPEPPIP